MFESQELRKLAEQLRLEEARRKGEKRAQCAKIVQAATGLDLLRRKLGGFDVG